MPYVFTAVYLQAEDGGVVAYVEELDVSVRAPTIAEAQVALREATELTIEWNRRETRRAFAGYRIVQRAPITVGSDDWSAARSVGEG